MYVQENQETLEEYWWREISWAIVKLKKEGAEINWRKIRDLTNISKQNYLRILSFFENDISKYKVIKIDIQ